MIKRDSPYGFLKLFLDFEILFIKVYIEPMGELYFLHSKRDGGIISQILGK